MILGPQLCGDLQGRRLDKTPGRFISDEMLLAVRTHGRPAELAERIRSELRQIDTSLPIIGITTMEEELGRALAQERLLALLASGFGLLALQMVGVLICKPYGFT